MRQRISFLRTLLAGKPVLALDEPFAALDAITRLQMQGWLSHVLDTERRTVVLVTHDVEEAIVLGDRVVVMSPRPGHAVADIEIALPRPGTVPTRASWSSASTRSRRWGWPHEAPAQAGACGSAARGAARNLGAVRRSRGRRPARAPAPHDVAKALYDDRSLLWSNFLVTAEEVLLGIIVAAVAALALAIAIHFSATLRRAVYPLLVGSQAVPIPVFASCSCCGLASVLRPSCWSSRW